MVNRPQKRRRKKNITKRNIKTYIFMFIGLIVILLSAWKLFKNDETNIDLSEIRTTDNFKGSENASVILTEFSDFQCPACASYEPLIKELNKDYPDRVKIIYKHFPLRRIHPKAFDAAMAAEAAGVQGKFWEMHDYLFENQEDWSNAFSTDSKFEEYAEDIGLDVKKFKSDMNAKELKNLVENEEDEAVKMGLGGTPSFFLNGKQIQFLDYDTLKSMVEEKLSEV